MLISKEGREYRKAIQHLVSVDTMFLGRVAVTVECHAPDRRRRDLDNLAKCLFDSLTGIAWEDDSQIDDMRIVRAGVMPRGMVRVEIRGI
jgi:crossover junction endodeoxyribonuclease RusA